MIQSFYLLELSSRYWQRQATSSALSLSVLLLLFTLFCKKFCSGQVYSPWIFTSPVSSAWICGFALVWLSSSYSRLSWWWRICLWVCKCISIDEWCSFFSPQENHCLSDESRTNIREHFVELETSLSTILGTFKMAETKEKIMKMVNNPKDFFRFVYFWWYLVIFGYFWWYLVLFGYVWWCLMTFGDVWLFLLTFDDFWWYLVSFVDIRWYLVIFYISCFRGDFDLDSDKLSIYVKSNTATNVWRTVTISAPRSKKGAGRSPFRRFQGSCTCDAGVVGKSKLLIKCCHIALVYATFFCWGFKSVY